MEHLNEDYLSTNKKVSNSPSNEHCNEPCLEIPVRNDYVLSLLLLSISMGLGAPNVIDLGSVSSSHQDEIDSIKNEVVSAYDTNNVSIEGLSDSDIDKLYHDSITMAYDYYRNIEPSTASWKIALDLKELAKMLRTNSYIISYYLIVNVSNYEGKISIPN